MRIAWLIAFAMVAACGSVENKDPDASSAIDATEIDAPPVVSCTPNQFVDCDNAHLRTCNATGDGTIDTDCGAPGCNMAAMRCNQCVPDSISCNGAVANHCNSDGTDGPAEVCALNCLTTPTPHCGFIAPTYLPNVCDTPATMATFNVNATAAFDTGLDTNCNGGIVNQTGGPAICVVRYGTITIANVATLTVTGGRALALVSDGALTINGTLDIAATGTSTPGPGGSSYVSGSQASSTTGGGGAGGQTDGGNGANSTMVVTTTHGALKDPLTGTVLIGGGHPANPQLGIGVFGGAGGGAATLISCRGTATVSGTIDAGGGGGGGGRDTTLGAQITLIGAGGGGSGGYVVIQGANVTVTGQLYANGGGGGGGCTSNDATGGVGGDGTRSTTVSAAGGTPAGGGTGGTGGRGTAGPGSGGVSLAGGGGSAGHFQVYIPSGVSPTLAPSAISPPFESNLMVQVH